MFGLTRIKFELEYGLFVCALGRGRSGNCFGGVPGRKFPVLEEPLGQEALGFSSLISAMSLRSPRLLRYTLSTMRPIATINVAAAATERPAI